jgi:hypothetical protein
MADEQVELNADGGVEQEEGSLSGSPDGLRAIRRRPPDEFLARHGSRPGL